ncbi:MAG: sigma-54-dependent Fis family transcriptional regulator [Acidobacteriota bacterium]|jgi:transcriptional regulator with PAS, ATPase and Fis domain
MAREGKFRQANGGILVLDEIGELPLSLQPKLLRALQEREISPVGGRLPVKVDVRVIAMTNSDLAARVRDGKFRQDLYFRLNGYRLQVPPLRQRRADIPLLVESFLRRFAAEVGKPIRGLSVKALRALVQAPWEGNVRELEHVMRRLVYLCPEGTTIDSSLLPGEILHPTSPVDAKPVEARADLDLEGQVEALERRLITIALARAKGNRSKAAKLLGISRNGLALKIERLGLE